MSENDTRTADGRLKQDPRPDVWENWQGAVLLRSEIREYCKNKPKLIDPFFDDDKHLKPASYHLSLGNQCRVNGEDKTLTINDPILKIPPHGIAIVRTFEKVNIPGFLIARWNLKVKKVYKGLVWVGSLQVDPGYSGYLFCPLYNLSNEEQKIEYKETLFTIDFVRTTKGAEFWDADPNRPTYALGALDIDRLKSAPKQQFDEMRDEIALMKSEITRYQNVTFTMIAMIVAALTVLTTLGATGKLQMIGCLDWLPGVLSFIALPVSIFALCISWIRRKPRK